MTPVAEWLNQHGHEAKIVMRRKYDPFVLTSNSSCAVMVGSPKEFYNAVRREIREFNPTTIHVNSILEGLILSRALAPFVPIVFQYHGSEVRGRLKAHPRVRLAADKIIVSTSDLQRYGEWYDGPVDSMFFYRGGRKKGTALIILPPTIHFNFNRQAKKFSEMHGLELTIVDCRVGERIPHDEMPEFLSRFEFYLDFKGVTVQGAFSLIAKEAYAVGCKVIHDSNLSKAISNYRTRTPEDYLKLYESLAKPSAVITAARLAYSLPRALLF